MICDVLCWFFFARVGVCVLVCWCVCVLCGCVSVGVCVLCGCVWMCCAGVCVGVFSVVPAVMLNN